MSSQTSTSPSTPTKSKSLTLLAPKSNRQFEKIKQALTAKSRQKKKEKEGGEGQMFEM